jgi:hypothetical protein
VKCEPVCVSCGAVRCVCAIMKGDLLFTVSLFEGGGEPISVTGCELSHSRNKNIKF